MKQIAKQIYIFRNACVLLFNPSFCGFGSEKIPYQTNWKLEEFSSVNQDEKEYSLEDIKGNVTIASFIFTSYTTVCSHNDSKDV
ncbi:MAG: SCO family protein [Bacillota bacterium]|nr:SCO family protein [Bacillota bacterium]